MGDWSFLFEWFSKTNNTSLSCIFEQVWFHWTLLVSPRLRLVTLLIRRECGILMCQPFRSDSLGESIPNEAIGSESVHSFTSSTHVVVCNKRKPAGICLCIVKYTVLNSRLYYDWFNHDRSRNETFDFHRRRDCRKNTSPPSSNQKQTQSPNTKNQTADITT